MSDRALNSWADGLSARERVRAIATTLTQPRSAEWVREEARVSSRQPVNDELARLVGNGQLHAIDGADDGNTKYAPNYQLRYILEVIELINTHTRDELREEIAAIQEDIDEWKSEFAVDSRDDLDATLTDDDRSSADIRERTGILRDWDRYEDTKRLLEHALELYDDARSLELMSDLR